MTVFPGRRGEMWLNIHAHTHDDYRAASVHSNMRAAESAHGLSLMAIPYSCTSESSSAIVMITCQAMHVPRVLHFSVFIVFTFSV